MKATPTKLTTTKKSFHISNLGSFGGTITTDLDGYVHLTADAWLDAPMDWGFSDADDDDDDDDARHYMAECLAEESRTAVRDAEAALSEWRDRT